MNKKALRTLYKQKRVAIPPEQQALLSQQIAQQALRLPIWDKQVFHSFLSIISFGEVDTSYLIRLLQERGKNAGRLSHPNGDGTYGTFFI